MHSCLLRTSSPSTRTTQSLTQHLLILPDPVVTCENTLFGPDRTSGPNVVVVVFALITQHDTVMPPILQ